jgi:ketosteroid isomerase-like protein
MSKENVETVRRGYELYAAGDLEGVTALDAGEAVVVPVRISGSGRASGAKLETRLTHLWVLRDGRVILGEVDRTTEEALEAAGKRG